MDVLGEDKTIFRSGGLLSAFKWAVMAFCVILVLELIGFFILIEDMLLGLLFVMVIPNVIILLVYYMALKRGIARFGLITYSLRAEYLAIMTAFILIFDVLAILVLTGELSFPQFGVLPLIIMLLVPFFVKK